MQNRKNVPRSAPMKKKDLNWIQRSKNFWILCAFAFALLLIGILALELVKTRASIETSIAPTTETGASKTPVVVPLDNGEKDNTKINVPNFTEEPTSSKTDRNLGNKALAPESRVVWYCASYKTTYRHLESRKWKEVSWQGKTIGDVVERDRTHEYVELIHLPSKIVVRLQNKDRVEKNQKGEWDWSANGGWEHSSFSPPTVWQVAKSNTRFIYQNDHAWILVGDLANANKQEFKETNCTSEYIELDKEIRLTDTEVQRRIGAEWKIVEQGGWLTTDMEEVATPAKKEKPAHPSIIDNTSDGSDNDQADSFNTPGNVLASSNVNSVETLNDVGKLISDTEPVEDTGRQNENKRFLEWTPNWDQESDVIHMVAGVPNPVNKYWKSDNGKHKVKATLVGITLLEAEFETANGKLFAVELDRLSTFDKAICVELLDVDLTNLSVVNQLFERARTSFLFDLSQVLRLRAKDGQGIEFSEIEELNPAYLKTRGNKIELKDLDDDSKIVLGYNRHEARHYLEARDELLNKRRKAIEAKNYCRRAGISTGLEYLTLSSTARSSLPVTSRSTFGHSWVRAHFKSDGTFVQGHFRTHPNDDFFDNWSTVGNTNPYTGKPGWKKKPELTREQKRANRKKRKAAWEAEKQRRYQQWTPQPVFRGPGKVWVKAHWRNGSWVRGHYRSLPSR